jgi:hypothetical protein
LLSFAVLLGAALDSHQLAPPIMQAYARHVGLTGDEPERLPGVLCGFPLLVGAWLHATWQTPAGPLIEQHEQRQ